MTDTAVARTIEHHRRLIERTLDRRFAARPRRLREAIRYSLLEGGKRIRPLLVLAAGDMVGILLARGRARARITDTEDGE